MLEGGQGDDEGARGVLKHLVFDSETFDLKMNTRALAPDCLIDVDPADYAAELALKDDILASDYHYYCQALPGTAPMQWDVIALLLPNMARHYPVHFALVTAGNRWTWMNRLLGTETSFIFGDAATLPLPPLDWMGRQVQEDLCVMDGNQPGTPLVAGHLCFAAGWCLDDKLGSSFLAIHDPVPLFAERIGRSADLMMQRIKPGRPTARVNWTLPVTDQLDCSPRATAHWKRSRDGVTAENAGTRCFVRSEWQTLSRLPNTNAVLFTIRTMRAPFAQAVDTPDDARRLANLVRTMPASMRAYKGMTDTHADVLVTWLERHADDLQSIGVLT